MYKNVYIFIGYIICSWTLVACEKNSSNALNAEAVHNDKSLIIPKPNLFIGDASMTEEQTIFSAEYAKYLAESIKYSTNVIANGKELLLNDPVLGVGTEQARKGPTSNTVRFYQKSFVDKKFESVFIKVPGEKNWTKASLGFQTKGYPRTFYKMELNARFFSEMTFLNALKEERPDDLIKQLNIFEFKSNQPGAPVKLRFKASSLVSNLDDKYPRNFHSVEIVLD